MTWRFDNGEVNGSVYHEEKNNFVGKIFQQFVSSSQAMMYGEILHKEYAVCCIKLQYSETVRFLRLGVIIFGG